MMLPLLALLAATAGQAAADCSVSLKNLPDPHPLLLKPGGSKDLRGFVALNPSGMISLKRGEKIILACPNTGNSVSVVDEPQANASCVADSTFSTGEKVYDLADIKCEFPPKPSAKNASTSCGSSGQYQMVELGYQVGSDFYTLIYACFNRRLYTTVYDHFTMPNTIKYQQKGVRFGWLEDGFFNGIDMGAAYNVTSQQKRIGELLGGETLGQKYIQQRNHFYLSRGHLTAKCDFIFRAQQHATFLYLNAVPQWQTINDGNWQKMENFVRSYALGRKTDLEIYTGTHGIATLPDVNNVETELYLHVKNNEKYLPVPKIFWKIVYKATARAAVVFVSVNNPYINNPWPHYSFCTDVCSNIRQPNWDRTNLTLGYTYCCEYADFRTHVPDAPALDVHSLLTFS